MVLSPSGVTKTIHLAVGRPELDLSHKKFVPDSVILFSKSLPNLSFITFPQKLDSNPSSEIVDIVLATDPPESVLIISIFSRIFCDSSLLTIAIVPLDRLFSSMKLFSTFVRMSKTAFPIPIIFLVINFFL